MKLIVGLGNPGGAYAMTRHNIGFLVLDRLAERHGLRFRRSWRFPARRARGRLPAGGPVVLLKPQTFMNRSGRAVAPALRRCGGKPEDLLVIYDDAALDAGRLRIRAKGSAGGHNGVQSIVDTIGSGAFGRIRVGIGRKPDMVSLSDHVLGPFSAEERRGLDDCLDRAADAAERICAAGIERAMNEFNG